MNGLSNPALILIDVQQGIDEHEHWGGNRNNQDAEKNIEFLLGFWRKRGFPIVIVQHHSTSPTSPFRPDYVGNRLKDFVVPKQGEKSVIKSTASAFINTDLTTYLQEVNIDTLEIVGFVTNNSVEATTRNAGDLGFHAYVVSDATACFDKMARDGRKYTSDLIHQISLSNLEGRVCHHCKYKGNCTIVEP
jgi:nicotinamidase-related amidase